MSTHTDNKEEELKVIKVLMVEDNLGDARLVQEILAEVESVEYDHKWAKSLSETIENLEKLKFDVVLLDLSLPDSHGLETVIKVTEYANKIPIIVLTGLNDETVGLKAVSIGAQDYLVKGQFDPSMLSRVIRYAIERKNIQEALRDSESKLKAKNEEILEFTNVVTHDLKKPLATMKTICSIIGSGNAGALNEDGVRALAMGKEAITYMQEMLGDLLACAKLEAGTQSLEYEDIDVNDVLNTVLQRFKLSIQEKNITVTQNINGCIYGDRKGITKLFMNLIGNAVNYIGDKPNPQITVGSSEEKDGNVQLFFVKDTGLGIPKNNQQDIFTKFKRGPNVTGTSGTGLGMSIIKGVVEAHGGKLWLESTEGEGTTFYFTLPKHIKS